MTCEKLKMAVANMIAYLEECHDENDTITLTANVLKSIKENYEELIKFKNKADFVKAAWYNELREDFIDFVCSGVPNPAPYCKNRCAECVDSRMWCTPNNCKGFNPDGRRDT